MRIIMPSFGGTAGGGGKLFVIECVVVFWLNNFLVSTESQWDGCYQKKKSIQYLWILYYWPEDDHGSTHVCQDTVYAQYTLYMFDSNEFLRYRDQQNRMTDIEF
jgi:hypothetical protein